MGFGSYDESERENHRVDSDQLGEAESRMTATPDGDIRFEYGDTSSEDLLALYEELKHQ